MTVIFSVKFPNKVLLGSDTRIFNGEDFQDIPGAKSLKFGKWRMVAGGVLGEVQSVFRDLYGEKSLTIADIASLVESKNFENCLFLATDNKTSWKIEFNGGVIPLSYPFTSFGSGGETLQGYVDCALGGLTKDTVFPKEDQKVIKEVIENSVIAISKYHLSVGPEMEWV